jgi:hypothetical protein
MDEEPRAAVGACWECGYSLRGLGESRRCPECGRAFDPADVTTMNMGTEVGAVARWLMRPPGWPLYVMTAVAVLTSLWAAATPVRRGAYADLLTQPIVFSWSMPNWYSSYTWRDIGGRMGTPRSFGWLFLWGASAWAVVLGSWTARRVARGVTVRRLSKQKPALFAYWRRWLVPLVVFGVTVAVCATRWPIAAGFWLTKGAWERAAADGRKSGNANFANREWIGLVPLAPERTWRVEHAVDQAQVWFILSDTGGFVWCEDDLGPSTWTQTYGQLPVRSERVAKNWFSFSVKRHVED